MTSNKVTVILAAAGAGLRFGNGNLGEASLSQPKQFGELDGVPMFIWSLTTFLNNRQIDQVILVVPEEWQAKAREALTHYLSQFVDRVIIITGGKTRQESVYLALEKLTQSVPLPTYVLVHDAARPLVDSASIEKIIETLKKGFACTLGIPVSDSVKTVNDGIIVDNLDRNGLILMQTPQGSEFRIMLAAHRQAREKYCVTTDDAAIVQAYGVMVKIVPGSRFNLKITQSEDMLMARALIDSFGWSPGKVSVICEKKI